LKPHFELLGVISSPALEARLAEEMHGGPAVTPEGYRRLQLEGMPPAAQAAFLAGKERGRERLKAQAAEAAHQAGPHRAPVLMNSIDTVTPPRVARTEGTMLTPQELDTARQLIARMNAPLTDDEKKIARMVGISEAAYLETRNEELAAKLPGGPDGLDAGEREVCRLLGMKPADYAAEKRQLAAEGR